MIKGFNKAQRAYDNMSPEGNVSTCRGKSPEDMIDDAIESQRFEERQAERKSRETGRYVYTEEEAKALNRLGW